jgi:hypothetical protein
MPTLLEQQISERSREISTDSYSMSIGELVSLYREGELEIHPEFQRFVRWEPEQKARWIESILLGIPLPSVFMSQTEKGKWEVVDGLQRIATILQLMGEFRDRQGEVAEPITLTGTRYLPDLEGKRWASGEEEGDDLLPVSARLKVKRARLDIRIVLNTSDAFAKYELFQRLNTGGSNATDQEVRNCILLMVNAGFYEWLAQLARYEHYGACLPLTERALKEQFDMELLVRFVVFRKMSPDRIRGIKEIGEYLTEASLQLANDDNYPAANERAAFERTFRLLADTLGEDAFKRYDADKNRGVGAPLSSVYEVMALGIGYYADSDDGLPTPDQVRRVWETIWENEGFRQGTGSGVRASSRLPVTISIGRNAFRS